MTKPFGTRPILAAIALALLSIASTARAQDEIFQADAITSSVRVYSRTASGDAAPIRVLNLATPTGVAVDTRHDELFVVGGIDFDLYAFPRSATNAAAPLRVITGVHGRRVDVDPVANELFVSSFTTVTVFARSANGAATPLRTLTGLFTPNGVRVDRVHDELAVLDASGVSFYPRSASGSATAIRTIAFPVQGGLDVDPLHDEVFVGSSSAPFLRVYSRTDGTLLRSVDGASTGLDSSCGLTVSVDVANGEILAGCGFGVGASIRVFPRLADGDVAPIRTITGPSTGIGQVSDLAVTKTEVTPKALIADAVDAGNGRSDANGVLEPGETVLLSSTWANSTASGVPLTSTFSNLTGPPGASYAINDATAVYGSIPTGGTATCSADCSAITVSAPATRPAAHWDVTVMETPSTQNLVAPWHIHVGDSFSDVPRAAGFYRFVETIFHNGVTAGCGVAGFCPDSSTTRAQMSVFLLLSQEGASYQPEPASGTVFGDVPASHPFAKWIEELSRRGVTAGCGGGNYCPSDSVTRAQMAVFLLRTKEGAAYTPPPAVGLFGDVPASSGFAPWVEELANRGITAGCGGGNYCPADPVTRGQMAVFLTTTFGLGLNGL